MSEMTMEKLKNVQEILSSGQNQNKKIVKEYETIWEAGYFLSKIYGWGDEAIKVTIFEYDDETSSVMPTEDLKKLRGEYEFKPKAGKFKKEDV